MPQRRLEVLLIGAKGLDNSNFLDNVAPYVILMCQTQEQRSSVAGGQGTAPEWNEIFVFTISGGVMELGLKIMDKDTFSSYDSLGEPTNATAEDWRRRRATADGNSLHLIEFERSSVKSPFSYAAEHVD